MNGKVLDIHLLSLLILRHYLRIGASMQSLNKLKSYCNGLTGTEMVRYRLKIFGTLLEKRYHLWSKCTSDKKTKRAKTNLAITLSVGRTLCLTKGVDTVSCTRK